MKDVKEAKHVPLRLTVGENSYVIGTLSAEDRPQLMFDLVFEKEFELSHGWKNGSVYFIGYTADDPSTDEIDSGDDVFSDEENVLEALNGKLEADVKDVKPDAKKSALVKDEKNAKVAEPKKKAESEDDDDSEDDSDDEDDSEDDSEDVPLGMVRIIKTSVMLILHILSFNTRKNDIPYILFLSGCIEHFSPLD